jgi:hypothetical protein
MSIAQVPASVPYAQLVAEREARAQAERERESARTIALEEHEAHERAEAENRQLRERLAELEEERERQDEAGTCPQCTHLRAELARRTESERRLQSLINWTTDLLANKTIPAACKLVLWYFYSTFFCMRPQTSDEEMHIGVEECADATGISKDTVRKATDRLEMFELATRRYEPYQTTDGEKRTLVHITLDRATEHPAAIRMEKTHGGKRIPRCPKADCQSTDVDRYTVQYCRACDTSAWYGQPGLRADADILAAKRATSLEGVMISGSVKKQDAFALSQQIDTAIIATETITRARTRPSSEPDTTGTTSKKQDAFAESEHDSAQIAPASPITCTTCHTHIEDAQDFYFTETGQPYCSQHGPRAASAAPASANVPANDLPRCPTEDESDDGPPIPIVKAFSPMTRHDPLPCQAHMQLNKYGQPAHALEKVVKVVACGSTRQKWSRELGCRVCAECETPTPG